MKKFLYSVLYIFIYFLAWVMFFSVAHAATGTITQSWTQITKDVWILQFNWTSTSGGAASDVSSDSIEGYVILAITNPDDTDAPTDDYDITITDADSVDVMGGVLADRDTANSEHAVPQILSGVYGGRWVHGVLTLNVSNAGDTKSGIVKLFIQR